MFLDGDEIYNRRTRCRKSQEALGDRVGVSNAQISKIESGQVKLTRDLATRIEHQLRLWENDGPGDRARAGYRIGSIMSGLNDVQVAQLTVFAEVLQSNRYQ